MGSRYRLCDQSELWLNAMKQLVHEQLITPPAIVSEE